MTAESTIHEQLEFLRARLPEPFDFEAGLPAFFGDERARRLVAGGAATAQELLRYLDRCSEPALAQVAVLLLSRFEPAQFYRSLLEQLARQTQPMVEAFEAGFWRIQLPEAALARDVIDAVAGSGNALPLLLLQRPVAAAAVRSDLKRWVTAGQEPFASLAAPALRYVDEPEGAS